MTKFLSFWKNNRFGVISWLVTVALVASLLGGAFWWKNAQALDSALVPQPTAGPDEAPNVTLPLPPVSGEGPSVERQIQLITNIPAELPRYDALQYIVERGDAMSKIAEKFKIETASILYNNKDELNDDPHGLKPGMNLLIPPVDGIFYTWKEGDTLEKVADEFDAKAEDIVNFPGNDVDLTNPDFKPGTLVMIPGGSRELFDWSSLAWSQSSGTGSGGNSCGGGRPGSGSFIWPVVGEPHTISGNNYTAGHLAIDMTALEGDVIMAADHGVVMFAGWSQYGYGNMVQIDHGNGYTTLYAHLTTYFVTMCQSVGQGDQIGTAGNTGNSFGAHLHFEIRYNGASVNPLGYVQ
ncbi:MAG TPA: LysM peptidoglycan-binding domain-containing M23 family metallopeptidase [Anaerolineales bacterium]|nr:LysM peptidoglycan-binding domain-containing M23 family metallopeptidase [Anaerolineales bacterium]